MTELPVIQCSFLTSEGTCAHVDRIAHWKHPIGVDACVHCCATYPDEAKRYLSASVKSFVFHAKRARLAAMPPEERKRVVEAEAKAKEESEAAKPPKFPNAPVVVEAEARMEICEDCSHWIGERCKAKCSCRERPRPKSESGQDCPIGRWRRK